LPVQGQYAYRVGDQDNGDEDGDDDEQTDINDPNAENRAGYFNQSRENATQERERKRTQALDNCCDRQVWKRAEGAYVEEAGLAARERDEGVVVDDLRAEIRERARIERNRAGHRRQKRKRQRERDARRAGKEKQGGELMY
jgi:hypothetical protein